MSNRLTPEDPITWMPTVMAFAITVLHAARAKDAAAAMWMQTETASVIIKAPARAAKGMGRAVRGAVTWMPTVTAFVTTKVWATNIAVEAWFYDSGEPDAFGGVIAVPGAPTDPNGGAELGLFPSAALGGRGGRATHSTYYTGTGDWDRKSTGIARQKGWHKVRFTFTPAGGSIQLDEKLVAQSPDLRLARSLFLGNPWGGSKPMYFDDVAVMSLSGPAAQ